MEITANLTRLSDGLNFVLTRRRRAQYIGCLGIENLGDDALYLAIQDIFARHITFATTRIPRKISNVMGEHINPHAIFLGGGTLIKKSKLYLKRLNEFKRLYPQAKTIIFGTGVGDMDMWNQFGVPTDVSGWCEALERADYVSVRGPLSKQHLERWGVTRQVEVVGDPAVWFARDRIVPKRREKRIGINLGFTKGQLHGQDDNVVLSLGVNLLKRLKADHWQITLFPVVASDIPFLHEAVAMAGIETPPMHMDYLNVRGTLNALEQQDVFIGEKLHSVVLANCVYTPAIMLEYRTKCRDYMLSTNQSDCSFRTDEIDADLIYDKIHALYDNAEQYQSHLFTQLQQLKSNLSRVSQDVIAILNR